MVAGYLREKRGIYQIVLQYKDSDGKRREKSISTKLPVKNNKKKAEQLLLEARREFIIPQTQVLTEVTSESMLFTSFLKYWLQNAKTTLRASTHSSYSNYINVLTAYFEERNLTLSEIKKRDIEDFYFYLRDIRKVSENTVKHYHAVLRIAFNSAEYSELITRNPMRLIKAPKAKRYQGSFYTIEQVNTLFSVIRGHHIEWIIRFILFYGLRRSEVVGLKFSAFDFERNEFEIKHTVTQATVNGKYTIIAEDETKNDESRRVFPLVPLFRDIVLRLHRNQEANKRLCGNSYNYEYDGYLCVDEMGNLLKPQYITDTFKKILEKNDLPKIRLHDLRHTCASILLEAGFSMKEIQAWLGHADFLTTANIYTHLQKDSKLNIADGMLKSGIDVPLLEIVQ